MLIPDLYDDGPLKETIKSLKEECANKKAKLKELAEKREKLAKLEAERLELENTLAEQKKLLADKKNKLEEVNNEINDLKLRREKAETIFSNEESERFESQKKKLGAYKALTGINWDLKSCSDTTLSGTIANPITIKLAPFRVDRSNESSTKIRSLIAKTCE